MLVNLAGPILINRWFKNNTGTALGILMACVGIFGAFLQPLALDMISGLGWRKPYLVLGGSIAILILLFALLFLKNSLQEKGLMPLETKQKTDSKKTSKIARKSVDVKTALKSSAFYFLLVFMISITAFASFSQHMALYGESIGYAPAQMGKLLSISIIGSTIGAILIGVISDKLRIFKTSLLIVFRVVASIVCLTMGKLSLVLFAVGSLLLGLSSMGIPVLAPLLTSAFFGEEHYETLYSNAKPIHKMIDCKMKCATP